MEKNASLYSGGFSSGIRCELLDNPPVLCFTGGGSRGRSSSSYSLLEDYAVEVLIWTWIFRWVTKSLAIVALALSEVLS